MSNEETFKINFELNKNETINKLEKIKQLLEDINKLDGNFNLKNVIDINKETILLFNTKCLMKQEDINILQKELTEEIGCKCLISNVIKFENAFNYDIDEGQEKDYTTETFYIDEKIITEKTIQYK